MTKDNTQSAECLSHLTAELGTISDEMRLDWLEKNTDFSLNFRKKRWSCTRLTSYEYNTYKTMREAIDAAINGTWQD